LRSEIETEPTRSQPFIDSLAPVTVGSDWREATLRAAKFDDNVVLPFLYPQPGALIPGSADFYIPCGDRIPEFGDILVDGNYTLPAGYPGLDNDKTIILYDTTLVYMNGTAFGGWSVLSDPNLINGFNYTVSPPGLLTGGAHTLSVHLEGVESFDVEIAFDIESIPVDVPTKIYYPPYEPVVDLNMVRATLTNRARFYIARGMHDGTVLQPLRYVLGAGWESPRWGEPPLPAPDSTDITNAVYEADVVMEEANDKTLVLGCYGPEAPSYRVQEVLVYARILNTPYADEVHREIPFACATFPEWFHTPGQRFTARLVIPM
jgi:hypothetical protein